MTSARNQRVCMILRDISNQLVMNISCCVRMRFRTYLLHFFFLSHGLCKYQREKPKAASALKFKSLKDQTELRHILHKYFHVLIQFFNVDEKEFAHGNEFKNKPEVTEATSFLKA